MTPLLTVLIPTYRNLEQIHGCLSTLFNNTEYPLRVVVLNNDPQSNAALEQYGTGHLEGLCSVLNLESNKGWMGAINAGAAKVDTKYLCMLNDDVLFPPGSHAFWRDLCQWMEDNQSIAAVGPCSNFVMGPQSLFALDQPPGVLAKYLIGFCLVVRTEAFHQVGGLDETLPGGDDLDLSMSLRRRGWNLIADRTCYLHHIGCQTGDRVHAGYWNSPVMGDRTNNALIRKHGIKWWYDLFTPGEPSPTTPTIDLVRALGEEDAWRERAVPKEGRGMDLGAGARTRSQWRLDFTRPGERGAGGRRFEGAANNLTADATSVPVRDACLDYLTAFHLFEHLLDPLAALEEWKRVLKPGGRLILTMPDHERGMIAKNTVVIDSSHVHGYTEASVRRLLKVSGFDVLDVGKFAVGSMGFLARAL